MQAKVIRSDQVCFVSFLLFNPTWSLGLVTVAGYVFALGGFQGTEAVDSVERYDPNTNTWQLVDTVGTPEHCGSAMLAVALDGLIYVIVSEEEESYWSKLYKYNPETSVWTAVAPTLGSCHSSTACTLKGKIYMIGIS